MKKRILLFLISFAVIYTVNFFIPRLMPGDPFRYSSSVSGEDMDYGYSEEQLAQMKAYYGMDEPLFRQFVDTVTRNLRGDLGSSIYYKKPVTEVLGQRLPWSLYIMVSSLLISLALGSWMALCGIRRPKLDRAFYGAFSILTELPSFLIGILLLFLVAAKVKWIPLSGAVTPFAEYSSLWQQAGDILVHSFLPILAMVLVTAPQFFFNARASFLSAQEKPYLLNARSKGLTEHRIRWRYIFRNSLPPLVARFFLSVGTAVGGAILVENVFAYPGIGRVLRDAVAYRDYLMIQGVFLVSSILVLVSLFLADCINSGTKGAQP